jgi:hypothetical protein
LRPAAVTRSVTLMPCQEPQPSPRCSALAAPLRAATRHRRTSKRLTSSPSPSQVLFKYYYVLFSRLGIRRYEGQRAPRKGNQAPRSGRSNSLGRFRDRPASAFQSATAAPVVFRPATTVDRIRACRNCRRTYLAPLAATSKPAATVPPRSLRSLRPMTKPKPCQRFCTRS